MKDKQSKPVFKADYKGDAPRQFAEALLSYRPRKNKTKSTRAKDIASTLVYNPLRSRHLISLATCPHLVH